MTNSVKKIIPYFVGIIIGFSLCFSLCLIKKMFVKRHFKNHKMFDFVQISSYKTKINMSKEDFETSVKSMSQDLRKIDGLMSKTIFVDKDGIYYEITSWKDKDFYEKSLNKLAKSDSIVLFSQNIDKDTLKVQDGDVVGFFFSKKPKKYDHNKNDKDRDHDKEDDKDDTKGDREDKEEKSNKAKSRSKN